MNIFYTDGACKNNGDKERQKAYTCVTDESGQVIFNTSIGNKTNIQAEGYALGECARYIIDNNLFPSTIKTDSEFWVKVITGKYKIKKPHLLPLQTRLLELFKDKRMHVEWISREINKAGIYLEHKYEKGWDTDYGRGKIVAKCPNCAKKILFSFDIS